MADNFQVNQNTTSGVTIAADDISNVWHQYVKLEYGADGAATPVDDANPLPVDDAGGSLTVDAPVATPVNVQLSDTSETALISAGGALQVDVASALPAGAATIGSVQLTDGTDSVTVTSDGYLQVRPEFLPGTLAAFGHVVTTDRVNHIDVPFFRDTPQNLVTVTTANSGTATQSLGGALFTSSTNADGESKGVTTESVTYRSGAEVYALFTANFTAGVASSYQRIGLYDDNNGFFIGYEGTSFGVTERNNTTDTTTAKASFSEDDLTGGAGSLFTRAGSPEAIDLTKLNVFRIRYGWLGSAPVYFEVMAPDGHWVTFHKILYPNLQAAPSIRDTDLPLTLHINKTSAGATDLQMQTDCWAAGVTLKGAKLSETITDATIAPVTRTVIAADNGAAYTNIGATTGGNLKVSIEELSNGIDVGAGNVGAETQRVTIATDDVNLSGILADTANIDTNVGTIAGAVAAGQMQVDIVADGAGLATAANQLPDGHNVTVDNTTGAPANVQIGDGTNQASVTAGGDLQVTLASEQVDINVAADAVGLATSANQLAADHLVDLQSEHARNDAFSESIAIGGELDDTTPVVATEGNVSPVRITAQRGMHVNLRSNDGTELGTAGNPVIVTDDGAAILVDGSAVTQPVSGTVAVTHPALGGGAEAGAQRVTIANDSTGLLSVDDGGGKITVDWNGTDPPIGAGTEAAALRVTVATDSTGTLTVDNAGTFATQATLQASDGTDIGDVDVASIAAGSNLIGDVGISGARTSGGIPTVFIDNDLDNVAQAVKGSAGQLYFIHAMNLSGSVAYLYVYNTAAGSVTVGVTTPILRFPLPTQGDTNGAGFMFSIPNGIAFGTAISVAASATLDTSDDPGANAVHVNVGYA